MSRKRTVPGVDRRQQIIAAALEIFAEQGFEAATNKAIAERAEVNQGLIYFYFESKADVYFTTFAYHTRQVVEQLDTAFAHKTDAVSPADDLARLLKEVMQILSMPPATHLLRLLIRGFSGGPVPHGEVSNQEKRQAMAGFVQHLSRRLREYLEWQMERGAFRKINARHMSSLITRTLIVSVGSRAAIRQHAPKNQFQPELDPMAEAEALADLYCNGLLARGEDK